MPTAPLSSKGSSPVEPPVGEARALLGLVQQMAVTGRQFRRALTRQLDGLGLNDTELLLLWACDGAGSAGIAQNRLAEAVGLSPAQVSGLVDKMGNRGLIATCAGDGDRRRRMWQLTSAGRRTVEQVVERLGPAAAAIHSHGRPTRLTDLTDRLAGVGRAATRNAPVETPNRSLRVFPAAEGATAGGLGRVTTAADGEETP